MEELEVLPGVTPSKGQPCRAKLGQDAVSSLTDPSSLTDTSSLSPDLAAPRGDDHCPTL